MDKIPAPITFNAHKHHFRFLQQQIENWKKAGWQKAEKELLTLGDNLLDFYTGKLSVENIGNECLQFFRKEKINDFHSFRNWLGGNEYRKIPLSDSSIWIVKQGVHPKRYIHIHPAKYTEHALRIRAVTLKTVLALQILSVPVQKSMNKNLKAVNNVRKNYLHLSPVKSLSYDKGIFKIWRFFEEN